MKRERFKGSWFDSVSREGVVDSAILSDDVLDTSYRFEDESYHLKATSSDGCVYIGRIGYARAYVDAPKELGTVCLQLYRSKNGDALLCGTYVEGDEEGHWVIDLKRTPNRDLPPSGTS